MDKKCFLLRVRLNQWTGHISPCLVIYNLHMELPMDCLNGICGINDPPDIFRVLEILAEPFPVAAPGFDYDRIFVIPFFLQISEILLWMSSSQTMGYTLSNGLPFFNGMNNFIGNGTQSPI